jgi:precorrin-2/cobalt-factor-2 C20-methyltransferase
MIGTGTLQVIGLGPGDPELVTLKAARLIAASTMIAYFAKRGRRGHARSIAAALIPQTAEELRLEYPFTTEFEVTDRRYITGMAAFYADCTERIARQLDSGLDVSLLCEGDPFFYGSSLALLDRLGTTYRSFVVPGVTGMSGCWTRAGVPMTHGDDVLTIVPGTLDEASLEARLAGSDAAVIMKVGRNLSKIRGALRRAGRADIAIYVERGTMPDERILPLTDTEGLSDRAPYFAMVLVPGRQQRR